MAYLRAVVPPTVQCSVKKITKKKGNYNDMTTKYEQNDLSFFRSLNYSELTCHTYSDTRNSQIHHKILPLSHTILLWSFSHSNTLKESNVTQKTIKVSVTKHSNRANAKLWDAKNSPFFFFLSTWDLIQRFLNPTDSEIPLLFWWDKNQRGIYSFTKSFHIKAVYITSEVLPKNVKKMKIFFELFI